MDKVEFSSKDNELELMIKEKGSAFKAYRGDSNPLSNAFFVYLKDASNIRKTSAQIKKIDGVASTAFGGDSVTSLVEMLNMIQKIGLGLVALLVILSLYPAMSLRNKAGFKSGRLGILFIYSGLSLAYGP